MVEKGEIMKLMKIVISTLHLIALTGCVATRVNLKDSGDVQVNFDVPKDVSISAVPYESEGNFIVLGKVSRSPISVVDVKGHVDIRIVNPDGELVSEWQVHLRRLPSIRHRSNPGAFSFSIPGVPPRGSIINVKYDNQVHEHSNESAIYKKE